MATLIPSLGTAQFDSRGELRLREFLEDNTYIWHNLPMGPRGRHPDFVIVHPARGLLVLEVKDWRLDTIAVANKVEVELHTANGMVKTSNPFEQARRYAFDLNEQIQRDGRLVHPAGHAYKASRSCLSDAALYSRTSRANSSRRRICMKCFPKTAACSKTR